jgi:polysaccharide deacetylase 2 family uncharacterized protein YibQ
LVKTQRRKTSPRRKTKKGGRKIPLVYKFLVCLGIVLAVILYLHMRQPPSSLTERMMAVDRVISTELSQLKIPPRTIHKESAPQRRGEKTWTLLHWEVTLPSEAAPEQAASQLVRRIRDAFPGLTLTQSRMQGGAWAIRIKVDNLLAHHLILRPPAIKPPPVRLPRPRIAIVVDDLGLDKRVAEEFLRLEAPLTFSILPFQPSSRRIARKAHAQGREVILHLPMEPRGYPLKDPGAGALFVSMGEREIARQLCEDLDAVPFIQGVNNHMGSRFMEHEEKVRLVLRELKKRELFFLDSRTTSKSTGYRIARELALKADIRDLFLDNDSNVGYTRRQLKKLIRMARDNGTAIGICHPYPSTITALKEMIPQIQAEEIQIVPLSQALDGPNDR